MGRSATSAKTPPREPMPRPIDVDVNPKPDAATARGTAPAEPTPRRRFLDACRCRPVARTPLWLMRQAGRALPEYRALKRKHDFLELIRTPDLAAEVTLQPIRRFDFDAAVLFSDILVVAEALGQPYRFRSQGGIEMDFAVRSAQDVDRLAPSAVAERLQYVAEATRRVKSALGERTAVLGFAGSPWTLANFMVEGGSSDEFTRARSLFYSDRPLFARLLEKLTTAVIEALRLQVDAGADVVQIFDSLGGSISGEAYAPASACWIQQIVATLDRRVPVILFGRGVHDWETLAGTGAQVIGVDWQVRLAEARRHLPGRLAVQGNLDPFVMTTTPEVVAAEAAHILDAMDGAPGHIFNLGHGLPPETKLENLERLVETVRTHRPNTCS